MLVACDDPKADDDSGNESPSHSEDEGGGDNSGDNKNESGDGEENNGSGLPETILPVVPFD